MLLVYHIKLVRTLVFTFMKQTPTGSSVESRCETLLIAFDVTVERFGESVDVTLVTQLVVLLFVAA